LEWARNEALFAAEQEPLTPARLAAVPVCELPELRPQPHPSVSLLESSWPIHTIWDAHQPAGGSLGAVDLERAETVLVWRQNGTVRQRPLTGGEFALLAAFVANCPLAEAAGVAGEQDPKFDFAAALARLLSDSALVQQF